MSNTLSKCVPFLAVLFTFQITSGGLYAQQVHKLESNAFVKEFSVAGPFHDASLDPDDFTDLLEFEFIENEGGFGMVPDKIKTVLAETGDNNFVNFNSVLGGSAPALAYAHFEVSAREETGALFQVSAADGMKIYLNGLNIHSSFGEMGRNYLHIHATLQKGLNNVVIKVPNRDNAWRLSVKLLDGEKAAAYLEKVEEESEYQQLLQTRLQVKMGGNSDPRLSPGRFPELDVDKPQLVKKYLGGSYHIATRWFDADLAEVHYPAKSGRYAYYAEITGKNGITLKRSATLFCSEDWKGFRRLNAGLDYIPASGISESTWSAHQNAIGEYAGLALHSSMILQGTGSVLFAFTDLVNKKQLEPGPLTTPMIVNGDFHAKLKQKILGIEDKFPELQPPAVTGNTAPALEKLSGSQAGQYEEFISELVQSCNGWMEDGGAPFDIMIAKGGKILFHGSFGEDEYGKYTTETPTEIASITKLLTGMLFAQFVDQGIIGIDDPVGKYLPDFPVSGPNAVTMRHCFTHTCGFYGHYLFNGVHNPWLENTLAMVIKDDTVGRVHLYNGMGYDLAGKVMEAVTGKSIFRLFREYLYDPLEMDYTVHDLDLAFSCNSTAYDLAKVAQLLLNKGTYGDLQFFSPETYEKIIPKDLNEFYPGVNVKWGIGINYQRLSTKDEKTGEQRSLLDNNMLGHGSAAACIFWVDRKHDLVITQTRRARSGVFWPHLREVTEVVDRYVTE